jgi:hypothetical protein
MYDVRNAYKYYVPDPVLPVPFLHFRLTQLSTRFVHQIQSYAYFVSEI